MCKDCGIQPSIMTDLKMGRRSSLKIETASKIADYFGVSVEYLLGNSDSKSAMISTPTDDDIKFALFDGAKGISDEAYEEVKRFAAFIKEKIPKGLGDFAIWKIFSNYIGKLINKILF